MRGRGRAKQQGEQRGLGHWTPVNAAGEAKRREERQRPAVRTTLRLRQQPLIAAPPPASSINPSAMRLEIHSTPARPADAFAPPLIVWPAASKDIGVGVARRRRRVGVRHR